jgi:hypothetical protein
MPKKQVIKNPNHKKQINGGFDTSQLPSKQAIKNALTIAIMLELFKFKDRFLRDGS